MHREFTDEYEVIKLHFPGIKREELSLRSDDGVLFVGLNGRERSISTSVPVKANQVDAKLEEDVLRLNIPLFKE
jgi:HSP20 family molecular chaperone IbpA